MAEPSPNPTRTLRLFEAFLLLLATTFFALHFVHLTADFPNHSPWMDWSKYTDEGWYGDAAIRHFTLGHWYVPGDFNPAAALPVWPLAEAIVFRFAGVHLAAARALTVSVFGAIMISAYFLLRRGLSFAPNRPAQLPLPFARPRPIVRGHSLAPAIAVLLLSVSPFCFVFTRIAILEPLLILLTLLALHAAGRAIHPLTQAPGPLPILSLGLLLPAMILTKTTALFLFPAVFFLLWASSSYRIRPFLRAALPASFLAAAIWSSYFFLVVRPHFLTDYRYLFSANAYTGITAATAVTVLRKTVVDFLWVGKLLYPLSIAAILVALTHPRRLLRHQPLAVALLLWIFGYAAFLAYHNNLQPRYYLVPAVPLILLTALLCAPALMRFQNANHLPSRPILATAVSIALAAIVIADVRQTVHFLLHPEYTLIQAAGSIAEVVKDDPTQNPLILSISGSDISLITGLPSICDDFGTLELADRVKRYRPGWYAAWNQIDDDKMDALSPLYHPVRVAAFPAMDDPVRNLLILYRLDPKTPTPRLRPRRQPIPRSLQTKIGQQPSVTQLEH